MTTRSTALTLREDASLAHPASAPDVTLDPGAFAHAMELSKFLAQSQLIPRAFQNKPADVFMALILARRMGEDVFTILQNVHFVGNKPGWSASFMIARANQSGIFSTPLTWETTGSGEDLAVTCSATLAKTGQVVSRCASWRMAKVEQWIKNPKYNQQGLAEQMLAYRSSTLLLRLYAPQILLGLHTEDEWQDVAAARGEPVEYTDPLPSSSPPRERPRALPAPPGVEHVAAEAISSVAPPPSDLPPVGAGQEAGATPFTMAASSGEDSGAHSAEPLGSSPSTPASPSPAPVPPSLPGDAVQGAGSGEADAERAAVLAEVTALREACPNLLREEAQALGLQSPAKAPTLRLRELVIATRGRRPLLGLSDEALLERLHAAMDAVGDADYACVIVLRYGLPIADGRPVTDGAPRPMLERCLVTLLLVAEQQCARQAQREDKAVRWILLGQAKATIAELGTDEGEVVLRDAGVTGPLEEATEAQLRQVVTLGRGGVR